MDSTYQRTEEAASKGGGQEQGVAKLQQDVQQERHLHMQARHWLKQLCTLRDFSCSLCYFSTGMLSYTTRY